MIGRLRRKESVLNKISRNILSGNIYFDPRTQTFKMIDVNFKEKDIILNSNLLLVGKITDKFYRFIVKEEFNPKTESFAYLLDVIISKNENQILRFEINSENYHHELIKTAILKLCSDLDDFQRELEYGWKKLPTSIKQEDIYFYYENTDDIYNKVLVGEIQDGFLKGKFKKENDVVHIELFAGGQKILSTKYDMKRLIFRKTKILDKFLKDSRLKIAENFMFECIDSYAFLKYVNKKELTIDDKMFLILNKKQSITVGDQNY